ncbi:MAG: proton-conducting transporter transmembrane domain-containing protein [Thermoplasmataceae archaeon]
MIFFNEYFLYFLLFVPLVASLAYFTSTFKIISIIASIITAMSGIILLLMPLGVYGPFFINDLNRYLVFTVTFVYVFSSIFASGYHKKLGESKNLRLHYSLINLFVFTMLFTLIVDNFGLMWIGLEATTASSALLLIVERGRQELEAAWRYVILVSSGLSIALIAIILIFSVYHHLTITDIIFKGGYNPILAIAGVAALIGFGTKIGIFPMHTWLPDAHSQAPSEISAMFSGILLPVAVYCLYEFYLVTAVVPMQGIFMFFIFASLIFVALVMPSQTQTKRMFAYSTMENMSIALLGLITGGIGFLGAILILLSHAFAKSGAFYSSGNILEIYGTRNINMIKGMKNRMPYTSSTLLLSSLAVTGAPPFATFIGEFFIIYQLIAIGQIFAVVILVITLLIISLSVVYKVSMMIFDGNENVQKGEPDISQLVVTGMSVALCLSITFLYLGGLIA